MYTNYASALDNNFVVLKMSPDKLLYDLSKFKLTSNLIKQKGDTSFIILLIGPAVISALNCYRSPHEHSVIACDWISSAVRRKYLVSVADAQLTEVNYVVVSEQQVLFSDSLLRAGEVYTISVENALTQFIPAGELTLLFGFQILLHYVIPLQISQISHHLHNLRY